MIQARLLWFPIFAVSVAAHAADCCKGSVAIIASLSGQASVHSGDGTVAKPASSLEWLAPGVTIEAGVKSNLTIILVNGRRYELGERARVTVNADALIILAEPVRELPRLPPIPQPAPIAGNSGEIAGAVRFRGADGPRNLYPNATAMARPDAVKLSFSTVPAATSYTVTLADENDDALWTHQTRATSVDVPPTIVKAGSRYVWRVRAIGAGAVLGEGEARFATISQENLTKKRNFTAALAALDAPTRHALLASVDLQLGLLAEAIDEFEAALGERPGDSEIQRALAAAKTARAGVEK